MIICFLLLKYCANSIKSLLDVIILTLNTRNEAEVYSQPTRLSLFLVDVFVSTERSQKKVRISLKFRMRHHVYRHYIIFKNIYYIERTKPFSLAFSKLDVEISQSI